MKRREFIGTLSAAAVLGNCGDSSSLRDSRSLIDTPAKRKIYLERMLDELVTDLGPRWVGTPAMDTAQEIVRGELAKAVPEVIFDSITFEKWELVGSPIFTVGAQALDHYPSHGTGSTPPGGLTGILKKSETSGINYDLIDPATGKIIGRVTLSPKKWAAPRPYWFYDDKPGGMSNVNVGRPDVPLLERAIVEKLPVFMDYTVKFTPNMTTANIIGKIPGKSRKEIVLYAHLDSVYNAPGANDNAASVIFILMLAHALSGRRYNHTLTFMATTGEEYGYLGTKQLAERRKSDGSLQDIEYIFDFDGVSWGPDMTLITQDEGLVELLASIDRELDLEGEPYWQKGEGVGRESLPFKQAGLEARGIVVDSVPDNEINELCWHRPEDTAQYVRFGPVEIAFNLFSEMVKRLDGEV